MAMKRHTADIRSVDVATPVRVVLPDGSEVGFQRRQMMEMKVVVGEKKGDWSLTLTPVADPHPRWPDSWGTELGD